MSFILCKRVRPYTIQLDQSIFYIYTFKTGVHFRFYREILKVIPMAYAKYIFDFLNKTVKPIHNK